MPHGVGAVWTRHGKNWVSRHRRSRRRLESVLPKLGAAGTWRCLDSAALDAAAKESTQTDSTPQRLPRVGSECSRTWCCRRRLVSTRRNPLPLLYPAYPPVPASVPPVSSSPSLSPANSPYESSFSPIPPRTLSRRNRRVLALIGLETAGICRIPATATWHCASAAVWRPDVHKSRLCWNSAPPRPGAARNPAAWTQRRSWLATGNLRPEIRPSLTGTNPTSRDLSWFPPRFERIFFEEALYSIFS